MASTSPTQISNEHSSLLIPTSPRFATTIHDEDPVGPTSPQPVGVGDARDDITIDRFQTQNQTDDDGTFNNRTLQSQMAAQSPYFHTNTPVALDKVLLANISGRSTGSNAYSYSIERFRSQHHIDDDGTLYGRMSDRRPDPHPDACIALYQARAARAIASFDAAFGGGMWFADSSSDVGSESPQLTDQQLYEVAEIHACFVHLSRSITDT